MSSTLAIAAAQSAPKTIRLRRVVRVAARLREQKGGEGHEHVVRDVRLEHDGVEARSLEPSVARKDAEPEQARQDERHEHRRQERRDAALAPLRLAQQVDQRGDRAAGAAPGSAHPARPSRFRSSTADPDDEQREEGERHPARPDCRESPRACRDSRRPRARRTAARRGGRCRAPPKPGSSMPSSTAAQLRTSSARSPRRPGDPGSPRHGRRRRRVPEDGGRASGSRAEGRSGEIGRIEGAIISEPAAARRAVSTTGRAGPWPDRRLADGLK